MRCMNCGFPLSPTRAMTNCPKCGASLSTLQGAQQQQPFEQGGWERSQGGADPQQNPWAQPISPAPGPFNSFSAQNQGGQNVSERPILGAGAPATPLQTRRPYAPPQQKPVNSRTLFLIAGLFVIIAAILLGVVFTLSQSNGNGSPSTTNTAPGTTPQAAATPLATPTTANPTPDVGETPTSDATYPGQQYIDHAQMASGVDKKTLQPVNPTTTFKASSTMYVIFELHAPSSGGAVCSYWYLGGKQVTSFPYSVKAGTKNSYTYAIYSNSGDGYVELYWATSKSCSDKLLAQKVTFTVTA